MPLYFVKEMLEAHDFLKKTKETSKINISSLENNIIYYVTYTKCKT